MSPKATQQLHTDRTHGKGEVRIPMTNLPFVGLPVWLEPLLLLRASGKVAEIRFGIISTGCQTSNLLV